MNIQKFQNWTHQHNFLAKTVNCYNYQKIGQFARVFRKKTKRQRKKKNKLSRRSKFRRRGKRMRKNPPFTQVNTNNNNNGHYRVETKINGEDKPLSSTLALLLPLFQITQDCRIRKVPNQQRKVPGRNQGRNQFYTNMRRVWVDTEYNNKLPKLPKLITKRNDLTPLLGVMF